jgi:hypothetical protein
MKPQPNRVLVPALLFLAVIVVATNAWLAYGSVTSLIRSKFQ